MLHKSIYYAPLDGLRVHSVAVLEHRLDEHSPVTEAEARRRGLDEAEPEKLQVVVT